MIGTFKILGNKKDGYRTEDTCTFNNWGTADKMGQPFPTRQEAEEYAQRCHDFKTGRRMSV